MCGTAARGASHACRAGGHPRCLASLLRPPLLTSSSSLPSSVFHSRSSPLPASLYSVRLHSIQFTSVALSPALVVLRVNTFQDHESCPSSLSARRHGHAHPGHPNLQYHLRLRDNNNNRVLLLLLP
ncbi:unnamed protein product [Mycena citricolor]|uniref:Uncharacterized protein n=1 Tax=Mycena citricolor TaxID=2018698 RepID=A0AAD2Q6R2_9AGAR|nr:unnamed protein product [Mycena citricolor]